MEPVARYGYLELLLTQWQSEDCSISGDPLDLAEASALGDRLWEKHSARILRNFEPLLDGRRRDPGRVGQGLTGQAGGLAGLAELVGERH